MSFSEAKHTLDAGLVALILIIFQNYHKIGHRPRNHPPGPPTLPLVGNLHQIPREKRHLQFEKWARQYGPIYSLILGTKVMTVLNSDLAIKDLLNKRGCYLLLEARGVYRLEYPQRWARSSFHGMFA